MEFEVIPYLLQEEILLLVYILNSLKESKADSLAHVLLYFFLLKFSCEQSKTELFFSSKHHYTSLKYKSLSRAPIYSTYAYEKVNFAVSMTLYIHNFWYPEKHHQ